MTENKTTATGSGNRLTPDPSRTLVSIIITHYNYSDYVRTAIESVMGQTHTTLECIVVDDCSDTRHRDALRAIVTNIADTRLSLVELPANKGQIAALFEGLAFAARDCYEVMGPVPREVRITGGAARSKVLRLILASVLNADVRSVSREEAGAAGAAMMAAVQQGLYPDMAACAARWIDPHLGQALKPDPQLVRKYEAVFPQYVATRKVMRPLWQTLRRAN